MKQERIRKREKTRGAEDRARLSDVKSGYVEGVSAVSGYLHGHDDNWYAFSILMNNCPYGTNNTAKEIQEKIVRAVDENLQRAE